MKSGVLEYDTVLGDGLHLQKILLNLLSNAVKYTQESGEISVQIEQVPVDAEKILLRFAVQDNGIGMSPAFLERIFEPFERAEDSRMSQVAGTGLGLAITKSIVDMMGGKISVKSKEREGSCFTVEIPLKLPGQRQEDFSELSGYSALLVSEDEHTCESIGAILREAGIRVQLVSSGLDAVEQACKAYEFGNGYNVVILDWQMSGMDRLETARQIRARVGNEVPILLLTASDCENFKAKAIHARVNGFLTKPIFKSSLLEQINDSIQGKKEDAVEPLQRKPEGLKGVRILVAEDNELNLEIIVELLKSSGAEVEIAHNGREAVERYLCGSPGYYQIVLMDVHMPEMNGLEATRAIRDCARPDSGTIPVVAMTADVFKEDIRKCMDAGMNAHIGKPLELDKLYATLQRLLNN